MASEQERCCGNCRFWSQHHGVDGRDKVCTFNVGNIQLPPWITFAFDGIVYDHDAFDRLTETDGTDCPAFQPTEGTETK